MLLTYLYGYQPLVQERIHLRATLPRLQTQAAQIHALKEEAVRLQASKATQTTQADTRTAQTGLQQTLEASANADMRKHIQSIKLESAERAMLTVDAVNFEQWIDWLAQLHSQHHIRVETVSVERVGEGLVNIKAVLVRI